MTHRKAVERGLFWTIVILFVVFVGVNGARIAFNIDVIPWPILVLAFGSVNLAHACWLLGQRRAFTMFAVTMLLSFAAEVWGVKAGILFGRYEYTQLFGTRLWGVPLIMPFAYFMQSYPCYLMANLLTEGKFVTQRGSVVWQLWLSLLGGMMMTAWDLTIDPLMSCNPAYPGTAGMCDDITPAWHWLDGGPYFGVPMQNFVGWMITCTAIHLTYRMLERKIRHNPFQWHYSHLLLLPIAGYGILTISDAFIGVFEPVRVISPFVMGIAAAASLMRVLGPDGGQRTMA
jgi:putative membrane protein